LDDPGARRIGDTLGSPLVYGRGKSLLRGVLGEFEIAKLTYESCNNPTPIRSIHCVNGNVGVRKHV
jgi:hypothetical protein